MPVVKVPVPKSYPARAEAVAKKLGLKDASEWELRRVRAFLAGEGPMNQGLIRTYSQWEDLEEIPDSRTGKPFHVKFDPAKALPLANGEKAGKGELLRGVPLTGKMAEWLARGVAFSAEAMKQMNQSKGLPRLAGIEGQSKSVAHFLSLYLPAELREARAAEEISELDK